jgi:hypothetical protein
VSESDDEHGALRNDDERGVYEHGAALSVGYRVEVIDVLNGID